MQPYRHLVRILMLCLIACFAVSVASDLLAANGVSSVAAVDVDPGAVDVDPGDHGDAHVPGEHQSDRIKERVDPGFWPNMLTLLMLVVLQAVLGFDNLLYISLESKNAPAEKRQAVRAWGIGLAIFLRIALLFALYYSKEFFEKFSVFQTDTEYFAANVNLHSLIVLVGGIFIMYTGVKEIWHMTCLLYTSPSPRDS